MRNYIFRFLALIVLICFATFLFLVFFPRQYDVPKQQSRAGTKYWELSTGSRIAYTKIPGKEPKKPYPIVYLHGGPGGPIYDGNIKILSPLSEKGYDIYLYDQIGGGHATRLENIKEYTVERHKADLKEIIEIIGTEKVILIGQSWGAMLASLYMADHSKKVEKAIFTGPGPILPLRKELAKKAVPDSLNLLEPPYSNREGNKKAHNIRSLFVQKWALLFDRKLAADQEMDDFATYLNIELSKSTVSDTSIKREAKGGAGYYAQVMTVKSFSDVKDLRYEMKKSNIPILVMKGQYDNQKWGFTNEYLELFSNHKLVIIPNTGHAISVERPQFYLKTISEFLGE